MSVQGSFTAHARKLGLALPAAGVCLPWTWYVRKVTWGSEDCWDTKNTISPHSVPRMWDFLSPWTLRLLFWALQEGPRLHWQATQARLAVQAPPRFLRAAPLGWLFACAWHSAQHFSCSFHLSLTQTYAASPPVFIISQTRENQDLETWSHVTTMAPSESSKSRTKTQIHVNNPCLWSVSSGNWCILTKLHVC